MKRKEKLAENKEISQFRLFLAPGIDFLGKIFLKSCNIDLIFTYYMENETKILMAGIKTVEIVI